MSNITDGGPAFPHEYKYGDGSAERDDGMTLLDYFAAKAMQAILSWPGGESMDSEMVAFMAYEQAEEMLGARPK